MSDSMSELKKAQQRIVIHSNDEEFDKAMTERKGQGSAKAGRAMVLYHIDEQVVKAERAIKEPGNGRDAFLIANKDAWIVAQQAVLKLVQKDQAQDEGERSHNKRDWMDDAD